jgi:hypothetical protein
VANADLGRANNNCLSNPAGEMAGIALHIKILERQRSFIASQEWLCVPKLWASIGPRLSSDPC